MAAYVSTVNLAPGNTSNSLTIQWSSFDSGANNVAFDVNNKDGSKIIILVGCHSTLENNIWIGTSDSRSSHTSMNYPFSAFGQGRMKIQTTGIGTDADPASVFMDTIVADTEVFKILCYGPFETARFKDSDGYINVCRGVVTTGKASHSSDEHKIAAILIP